MEKTSKLMPSSSPYLVVFLHLIKALFFGCKFAHAADTLLPGQSLSGNHSLLSEYGAFKLGFDGDATFGIWYVNSSACSPLLVWEPDELLPISETCSQSFGLSEYGNLYVKDCDGSLVWSSNYTEGVISNFTAVAILHDNGTLVIRDQVNITLVLWQSFDNPIVTLLPGQRLGFNRITGKNTSLISSSPFDSYLEINAKQSREFIVRYIPGTEPYGLLYREYSGAFPCWMGSRDGDSFVLVNDSLYLQLASNGTVSAAKLGDCGSVLWSAPDSGCEFGSYCPDSICVIPDNGTRPYCLRVAALQFPCNVPTQQSENFHRIDGVYNYKTNIYQGDPMGVIAGGSKYCEAICFSRCNCRSYATNNTTCLIWYDTLPETLVADSGSNGYHFYVLTVTAKREKSYTKIEIIVLTVIGALTMILVGLVLLWRSRRKLFIESLVNSNSGLMIFSNAQIKKATGNFSEKLGEGGFGYVFKGTLPGSSVVAVKKLKDLGQGEKQFRAEVQTIGMIQHINLVRLFGFCAEGNKRLLVYEYMENKSLNSHLFPESSVKLTWELRHHIALGTARGLAYLHEECKDCIIHCDMKPDNVLLDSEFCPKIADFGMAKLLGRHFSRALATMRGTIGYLAPEWISGLPITHKADVYSYGMMLLEIISGRRNGEKIKEGKYTYFPIFAAVKVNEGNVTCLLDSRLEGNADVQQLNRACKIACWCIQDAEDHRPMMGQVVQMLEGVLDVDVPPHSKVTAEFCGDGGGLLLLYRFLYSLKD